MKSSIFLLFCVLAGGGLAGVGRGADATAVHELEALEVVSTATRTERLAVELPIRTELLTPALFRAAGMADLASALEYLPGARVESNCQNCGTSELQLLGLGTGYNQLLFDGQPLFSGLAAVYGLEHIPTAFIERIEVVKGGASSLYGPGAVAGVVNIIPREPLFPALFLEASLESFEGALARAGVGVWDWVDPAHRAAATVYGESRDSEPIDLNGDGFTEVTQREFFTVGSNFWLYPAEHSRVSGNYAYTGETRRGGHRLDLPPHETQITERLEHRWHRGGLFWERAFGPDFSGKMGGSVSQIERNSYYGGVGAVALPGEPGHDPATYAAAVAAARRLYGYTESTRLYLDSIFTWHLTPHTVSFGAQAQSDRVFDEKRNARGQPLRTDGALAVRGGEDPIADDTFTNLGFFVQDEWDPTAAWTVIAGLRADLHSELDDWILSPRLAARYTASREWILRASVATGFRAPEIFDEDLHIEILDDPTRTRNAPDLVEERSVTWAAGFIWTPAFAEQRLQADVGIHHTVLADTFHIADRVFTDEAGNAFKRRENAGGATVQGFETNLLYRFTPSLSIEAGVNYTDARFDEAQEVLPGLLEARFVESPRWSGVAQLNYENEALFDAFLGVVYTGPMIAVNEAAGLLNRATGHFFVVDLSLRKHFSWGRAEDAPHLDLTIGVRNLLDARQDDLTTGPDRDAGYFYGPRLPRSYFLSATYHF